MGQEREFKTDAPSAVSEEPSQIPSSRPAQAEPALIAQPVANPTAVLGPVSERSDQRLSRKEKLRIAEYLDDKYGHACVQCGRACTVPYGQKRDVPVQCLLERDHIDGNHNNNALKNFAWRCNPCNLAKRPLDKLNGTVGLAVSVCTPAVAPVRAGDAGRYSPDILDGGNEQRTSSIHKNEENEPAFRRFLAKRLWGSNGRVPLYAEPEAINGGAEWVGCSPISTRRYLEKAVSPQGPYFAVPTTLEEDGIKRSTQQIQPKSRERLIVERRRLGLPVDEMELPRE